MWLAVDLSRQCWNLNVYLRYGFQACRQHLTGPFQFSVLVFHFSFPFPLLPNAPWRVSFPFCWGPPQTRCALQSSYTIGTYKVLLTLLRVTPIFWPPVNGTFLDNLVTWMAYAIENCQRKPFLHQCWLQLMALTSLYNSHSSLVSIIELPAMPSRLSTTLLFCSPLKATNDHLLK